MVKSSTHKKLNVKKKAGNKYEKSQKAQDILLPPHPSTITALPPRTIDKRQTYC